MHLKLSAAAAVLALLVAAGCNRADTTRTTTEGQPAATDRGAVAGENRSDARITAEIESRYFRDTELNGRAIDVTTRDGHVTLTGTVASEDQRQRAVSTARSIAGDTHVEDRLRVDASAANRSWSPSWAPMERAGERAERGAERAGESAERTAERAGQSVERSAERTGEAVNGAWITTKIQAQYFTHPSIRPWNVDVTTTNDGTVYLEGSVRSAEAQRAAEDIARRTDGVRRVENRLRVSDPQAVATSGEEPGRGAPAGPRQPDEPQYRADDDSDQPIEDSWITTKINSKYFVDPDVSGLRIDVDTRNGVVTLSGEVASESARRQALAIARNTEGVRSVNDQLRVTGAGSTERQVTGATRDTVNRVDDTWITTKVQSKFFLEGDIKGRAINVDTRNGVVTLTGTVETDAGRRLAEQVARDTEGVRQVVNQLTVQPGGSR